jgi:hypothetical protein
MSAATVKINSKRFMALPPLWTTPDELLLL